MGAETFWSCKNCGKALPHGKSYCNRRCLTAMGYRQRKAEVVTERVEWAGLAGMQASLSDAKDLVLRRDNAIERLEEIEEGLNGTVYALDSRVKVLEAQVAAHDERIMELTLEVRDLVRTLRALERKTNEGEGWKG